jgi:YkoY family integral membrane protein
MFSQTFAYNDLWIVAFLIILEGVLSIDNALVLGLLAKRLPENQRTLALTLGLVGAFAFRFIAIASASWLLEIKYVKLIGGGYLLFVALKYFIQEFRGEPTEKIVNGADDQPQLVLAETGEPLSPEQEANELQSRVPVSIPELEESPVGSTPSSGGVAAKKFARFWPTVLVIELTDIAFAVDSILAAIALVGPRPPGATGIHPKLWVVITGGMLGVVLMRFAAAVFIRLLERFPRFETAAYLLVTMIGGKLVVDYLCNDANLGWRHLHFHDVSAVEFWVFWALMMASFLTGFLPQKGTHKQTESV